MIAWSLYCVVDEKCALSLFSVTNINWLLLDGTKCTPDCWANVRSMSLTPVAASTSARVYRACAIIGCRQARVVALVRVDHRTS